MTRVNAKLEKQALEQLRDRLNRREYVHPDPLEFLYRYEDPADVEIVGLVASSLAYGRVKQILASVEKVLALMGEPARFVVETPPQRMLEVFAGFRHRFATGVHLAAFLHGAGRVVAESGSLEEAFVEGFSERDESTVPALERFAARLQEAAGVKSHLLPCPSGGSACKRLHLFLRWMVRRDEVDPGVWRGVPAGHLVVPLDTHMHRICRALGLSARKQADIKTAIEITKGFARFAPDDPVRYDFAITRLGIRGDEDPEDFLRKYATSEVA